MLWEFDPGSWAVKLLSSWLYGIFILECDIADPYMDPLASGVVLPVEQDEDMFLITLIMHKEWKWTVLIDKPFRSTVSKYGKKIFLILLS